MITCITLTSQLPPVACMCCDCGVTMVTDRRFMRCFLLPADGKARVVEEEEGVNKGDREAVGHLTPLTATGI